MPLLTVAKKLASLLLTLVILFGRDEGLQIKRSEAGVLLSDAPETYSYYSWRVKRQVHRQMRGFSNEDKYAMLERHNYLRSLEGASNMMKMEWDSSLEDSAQKYAEKCIFRHSPNRQNQDGSKYSYIGENLYAGTADFDPPEVVQAWYDEDKYYDFNTLYCSNVCGHYTQVVWADSKALGCGVKYCDYLEGAIDFDYGYNVVCHYGPGGNYRGVRPYKKGEQCSECPADTKYCVQGLCARHPHIGSGSGKHNGFGFQTPALHFVTLQILFILSRH